MNKKEITDAIIGGIGADRMAAGLPCIPDRISGDLEMILAVKTENKHLKEQVEYWQLAYKRETGTDIINKSKALK